MSLIFPSGAPRPPLAHVRMLQQAQLLASPPPIHFALMVLSMSTA